MAEDTEGEGQVRPARSQQTRPVMIVAAGIHQFAATTRRARLDKPMTEGITASVVAHDDEVGGVQRQVGAGPAHGRAGRGGGQGGSVGHRA